MTGPAGTGSGVTNARDDGISADSPEWLRDAPLPVLSRVVCFMRGAREFEDNESALPARDVIYKIYE